MFVSIGLKLVLLNSMEVLSDDGPLFIAQAEKFINGDWKEGLALNRYLFLYPLLIVCVHYLIPDIVLAGQLISLTASVVALIPIFLLTRGLFGSTSAFWGGLAFIVAPGFNDFAVKVMREPAFLCLFAWGGYFAWRALELKKAKYFILFFIFSTMSSLFRVEGIILPILFLVYLWFTYFLDKEKRPHIIKYTSLSIFSVALVYGVIRCFELDFSMPISYNNVSFYFDNVFNGGFLNSNSVMKAELKKMEIISPFGWNQNNFASIARNNIRLIYFIGLILCIANTVFLPFFTTFFVGIHSWKIHSKSSIFLIFTAVIYFLVFFIFLLNMNFIESRYVFATSVLLFPWIGLGLEKILLFKKKNYIANIFITAMITFSFLMPAYEAIAKFEYQPTSGKDAGIWLSEQVKFEKKKMVTNNGEIPFYSRRNSNEIIRVFTNTEEDFLSIGNIANREGAEIIAIIVRNNKENYASGFVGYQLIKRFEDNKYSSLIFQQE